MDKLSSQGSERDTLKATTLLPILSAYFIAVGALYLWGFWGSFSVNIMEYLGLTDVVKVAAWPVASAFFFLMMGFVVGEIAPVTRLPEGGGRHTTAGQRLNRHRGVLAVIGMVTLGGLLVFGPAQVWYLIAVLVGMAIGFPLRHSPLIVRLVPNDSIRSVLSFAAVVLPLFAFGQGRVNADDIRSGTRYFYVHSTSDGIVSTGDTQTSMRYVGYAGDTFFFWEPSTSVVTVVPASTVKALRLARTPKQSPSLWHQLTKRD